MKEKTKFKIAKAIEVLTIAFFAAVLITGMVTVTIGLISNPISTLAYVGAFFLSVFVSSIAIYAYVCAAEDFVCKYKRKNLDNENKTYEQ